MTFVLLLSKYPNLWAISGWPLGLSINYNCCKASINLPMDIPYVTDTTKELILKCGGTDQYNETVSIIISDVTNDLLAYKTVSSYGYTLLPRSTDKCLSRQHLYNPNAKRFSPRHNGGIFRQLVANLLTPYDMKYPFPESKWFMQMKGCPFGLSYPTDIEEEYYDSEILDCENNLYAYITDTYMLFSMGGDWQVPRTLRIELVDGNLMITHVSDTVPSDRDEDTNHFFDIISDGRMRF